MNRFMVKRLSLIDSKVLWWTNFVILGMFMTYTACKSSVNSNENDEYPYLMVVNQSTEDVPITAVGLVGYQFDNLNIGTGESQTFDLVDGMPGGYSNINIIVKYRRANHIFTLSIKKDFTDGDITTVRMKGCISFEGCNGFYLE